MEKSLKELLPGEAGVVVRVEGDHAVRRRLFDMGITPGTKVALRKTAPLGDPLELTVRGYELSIRKNEAESVLMKINEGESL